MNKPRISVVMSVYKEPVEWLSQSIDSILNQTFSDFEFIIICDNPAYKEGITTLKEYSAKDNRIRLIFNEENIGLTKSLNKGLAVARGEFIARMDADDISIPIRFEKQVEYMTSHENCGICGSCIEQFGDRKGFVFYDELFTCDNLFLESPFAHPTVMIRKIFLGSVHYNEEYRVSQDFELWMHLFGNNFYYYNIQKPLLCYRYSEGQIMSKSGSVQTTLSRQIRRDMVVKYAGMHGMTIEFPKDITFEFKRDLKKLPLHKKDKSYLLFCLYTSINAGFWTKCWSLLSDGDITSMNIKSILRVLKYAILRMDASKF